MARLDTDWLTDGLIDFEYKKYVLLSYFKEVKQSFDRVKLYPLLGDLVFHYNNLLDFKKNKTLLKSRFPNQLQDIDWNKLELVYKHMLEDDDVMKELEDIIGYALPMFKNSLEEGREIYEFVEQNCEITPIGLMPLYADEGYFFLEQPPKKETQVYRYQLTVFESSNERLRGIHTSFMETFQRRIGENYENLKISLSRKIKELPNPAVFLVHSKVSFPTEPTLIPVVKRLLVNYISTS